MHRARAQGKRVAISGSGNVAVYTVEKLLELGAVPLTVSDSSGYVFFEEGMSSEDLEAVNTHKVINRGRLSDFKSGADRFACSVSALQGPHPCVLKRSSVCRLMA